MTNPRWNVCFARVRVRNGGAGVLKLHCIPSPPPLCRPFAGCCVLLSTSYPVRYHRCLFSFFALLRPANVSSDASLLIPLRSGCRVPAERSRFQVPSIKPLLFSCFLVCPLCIVLCSAHVIVGSANTHTFLVLPFFPNLLPCLVLLCV